MSNKTRGRVYSVIICGLGLAWECFYSNQLQSQHSAPNSEAVQEIC